MPENAAKPTPPPAPQTPDAGHVPITEEFDSAKWTLPPIIPIVIGLAVVLVVIGAILLGGRAKAGASGAITAVDAVDLKDQPGILATVDVHISNLGEKPMWIKSSAVTIDTDQGTWTDSGAASMDFNRYFQAYPELKEHAKAPLAPETTIPPGGQLDGTILVSYPPPPEPNSTTPPITFTRDQFAKRKGLTVDIELYDRRPLQIKEKR